MNIFTMIVAIVAIAGIVSIARARYGVVRRDKGEDHARSSPDPEAERLRAEVKGLKERVAVLERLATERPSALDREFEKLRDRD